MAIIGEFGAARDEARKVNDGEPDQIKFYGETFNIADDIGALPIMEFSAAAAEGTDSLSMAGLAAMHSLLRDCLEDGEWQRFQRVAKANKAHSDVILQVCTRVIEALAGRPTVLPSDSSDGQPSTSQSSSTSASRKEALGLVPVDKLGVG